MIPGHDVEFYLGELSYARGLQLQSIDQARNGVKFEQVASDADDFSEIAGV